MSRTTNDTPRLSRRDWLKLSAPAWPVARCPLDRGVAPARPPTRRASVRASSCGWRRPLADGHVRPEARSRQRRAFKEIATSAPGSRSGTPAPIARFGDRLAVVRSMRTKEADHGRATYLMRTGYAPTGPIQYPPLGRSWPGAGAPDAPLPNCVASPRSASSTRPPTAPLPRATVRAAGRR